jgi:hypothetical protein
MGMAGTQLSGQRKIGLIPQRQVSGGLGIFPTEHRTKFSFLLDGGSYQAAQHFRHSSKLGQCSPAG